MKLFTKSDLERAARLAATAARIQEDVEHAVAEAVEMVAAETPPYYDEATVKRMINYATGDGGWPSTPETIDKLFKAVLDHVRY